MRYQVFGTRVEQVSVMVEADSAQDALDLAEECHRSEIDMWDSETNWFGAEPQA